MKFPRRVAFKLVDFLFDLAIRIWEKPSKKLTPKDLDLRRRQAPTVVLGRKKDGEKVER